MHLIGGVMVPFFTLWGNINFAQIMILQSWFAFWMFALEIPTGAVADYFGRKTSLALGVIINIIGAIIYASTPNFYIFMLGEFLWAMASALFSGANDAFVYDSLKKTKETKDSKKIFGRIESIHMLGILIGSPLGSLIAANFGLNMPMLCIAVPLTIAFFISLTLKEPETKKKIESKRYLHILTEGVRTFYKSKILKILALDMAFIATIGYFMVWMFQPMLKNAGIGIGYYGIVHSAFVASQIVIMNNYNYLEKIFGSKKGLITYSAVIAGIMYIIGGLTNYIPLVLAAIIIGGGFALGRGPLFNSYFNKYIPSSKRATVLSSISMLRRFFIAAINPLFGFAVMWSLKYTLIILGVIAIVFSIFSRVEEGHLID